MSVRPVEKTPRALGYRMPAEWEPHEATWLAWPHNPEDWPGKFQSIPWLYAEIVRLLAAHERVHLIVKNAAPRQRVTSMLHRAGADLDRVTFHAWPTDRGWTRDSGPIFLRNAEGRVALTNWRFNGWAKYSDWHLDDKLPGRVTKLLGVPAWQPLIQNREPHEVRARRRLHRRQRRRVSAHHRRVPSERGAAAQSGRQPRAT
jgi:agmatine deiminase